MDRVNNQGGVCHFVQLRGEKVMENRVIDESFPCKLEMLEKVTLRRIGVSRAFMISRHVDTIEGWIKGLSVDIMEKFTSHLSDAEC